LFAFHVNGLYAHMDTGRQKQQEHQRVFLNSGSLFFYSAANFWWMA